MATALTTPKPIQTLTCRKLLHASQDDDAKKKIVMQIKKQNYCSLRIRQALITFSVNERTSTPCNAGCITWAV